MLASTSNGVSSELASGYGDYFPAQRDYESTATNCDNATDRSYYSASLVKAVRKNG
jgi:hypothetical protein